MYVYLWLKNWLAEQEEGQDLIEYSLIIVLIVIVAVAGIGLIGNQIASNFVSIGSWLTPS